MNATFKWQTDRSKHVNISLKGSVKSFLNIPENLGSKIYIK